MADHTALTEADLAAVDELLADADSARTSSYPGDRADRQPVHTVYVPADRFHPELAQEWGAAAAAALAKDAPGPEDLAAATGLDADEVDAVWAGMVAKLESEPIEDLRVDLEDGYGTRPDEQEDRHAVAAGEAIAAAVKAGIAPPFLGIRFKSLEGGTRRRGLRSLDLVLGALLAEGPLPAGWVVTLPKVTSVAQVQRVRRRLRASGAGVRPGRACARLRDPGGDAAGDPVERRHRRGRADAACRGRAAARRCTSAPTTTPRAGHFRRPSGDGPPLRRPREVGHATGRGGHRRPGQRRLDQHHPGRRPGRGPLGLGLARPARAPLTGARLLSGLGPPSGPAADPLHRDVHVLPQRAWSGPARASTRT